jgi:hypothetical protein
MFITYPHVQELRKEVARDEVLKRVAKKKIRAKTQKRKGSR